MTLAGKVAHKRILKTRSESSLVHFGDYPLANVDLTA